MTRRLLPIGILNLALCLLVSGLTGANGANLLIKGGTLIDGNGGAPIPNARILIEENTIQKVWSGDATQEVFPPNTRVVEAGDKFIIPGLIDSHVHYAWYEGELFLSHGVTTIYDLGGGGNWGIAIQKGLNSGKLRGPRYYHASSIRIGGDEQGDSERPSMKSPGDAKTAVAAMNGKADIITLNETWKGEYFVPVAKEAHAAGLGVISHSFNALNSADWGIDGIEHMTGVGMAAIRSAEGKKAMAEMGFCDHQYAPILEQSLPCIAAGHKNSKLYQYMDGSYFDEMIQHLIEHHVFLNPTLDFEWKGIIDRTSQFELEDQKLLYNPGLQYVPEDERLVTLGQYHWADQRPETDRVQFLKGYKNVQEFLRKFVAAGGKLYSGTDSASANTPGLSLHHEMQLLVDAGIPPMKALQSSTKWAAEITRMDKQLGTVEAGKFADLVVLRKNPLDDIANTKSIDQVIKGGEIVDTNYHADYDIPFHTYGPVSKHLYSQPPLVQKIQPSLAVQGKEMWILVMGANFSPNSVVLFNGSPVETKWVGDKELSARLTAKQTAQPGSYLVGVETPKPGGGVTQGIGFIIDYSE